MIPHLEILSDLELCAWTAWWKCYVRTLSWTLPMGQCNSCLQQHIDVRRDQKSSKTVW